MWGTRLIGNQTLDTNGKTIPSDVMWGTYELKSLANKATQGFFEGKLVVDKTYGYAAHGCMLCCGYSGPYMYYDPFGLLVGGNGDQYIWATDDCEGGDDDITDYFLNGVHNWWTGNTGVATASNNLISAVGVGSTTNYASGYMPITREIGYGRQCPNSVHQPSGPVNVAPFITSISPQTGVENTTVPVTIFGGGFGSNPRVTTNGQILIQNVQVNQAQTQITANFVISSVATVGNYSVVVTNGTQQAATSFSITLSCSPNIVTPSQTIQCDGTTVRQALLVIGGADEGHVTNSVASATSSNVLTVDLQSAAYPYSGLNCAAGTICWAVDYIGYTNNQSNSANINWNVQVFCSNSPYPSQVVNQPATITCSH